MFDHAIEKELKILNIPTTHTINHTRQHRWAERTQPALITDQYRDQNDTLQKKWIRLKLRSVSNQQYVELIIKKRISTTWVKTSTETTKLFQQPELVRKWLILAGYHCIRTKQKIRTQATIDDMVLMIDQYASIPPLLEIEWPTEQRIFQCIQTLWLENHVILSWWYKQLQKYYKKSSV